MITEVLEMTSEKDARPGGGTADAADFLSAIIVDIPSPLTKVSTLFPVHIFH